jgi:hypothetical protein
MVMSSRLLCLLLVLWVGNDAFAAEPSETKGAQSTAPVSTAGHDDDDADVDDADGTTQGTIVQLERGTAFIDLGDAHGIRPGLTLQVLRTISAKHPVSGEVLRDHFPLGRMTLEQVSRVLSFGRLSQELPVPSRSAMSCV